jgi:hypothetical protein
MIPTPTVAGLHLCHDVTIDMDRHEITLTRAFHSLSTPIHPNLARHFWAFAELFGPIGKGNLTLTLMTLDEQRVFYAFRHPIEFSNRFSPIHFRLNLLLLCRLAPSFKPSRRQAVVSSPVVQPRFLVAP